MPIISNMIWWGYVLAWIDRFHDISSHLVSSRPSFFFFILQFWFLSSYLLTVACIVALARSLSHICALIPQIAIVGFLCVLGLSRLTTKPLAGKAGTKNKSSKKVATTTTTTNALKTPPRRTRPKEVDSLGTMDTPSGRRSARIASRRKED